MAMPILTESRHTPLTAPITIAITNLDTPIRFSPAVQAIINRCGPHPVVGGRYAAWIHGLLPQPGALIVFQAPRRALPVSNHPSVQIRHDHLDRRQRTQRQVVSLLDAAADMATFAHAPIEAAEVARRFLAKGGDASALRAAIALRPARFHERAMLEALAALETPAPQGANQHSHERAMLEALAAHEPPAPQGASKPSHEKSVREALTEAETTQEDKA